MDDVRVSKAHSIIRGAVLPHTVNLDNKTKLRSEVAQEIITHTDGRLVRLFGHSSQ